MRCGTGLHPHQTPRQLLEEGQNLTASQLPADNNLARLIDAVDLKNALRDIESDRGNFVHRTAPSSSWFSKTTTLAHCDAVGWEPSTASKADIRVLRLESS